MANPTHPLNQTPENVAVDPARCPLCGAPNDCRLCTTAAYKGPCWCESVKIPDELLVRIPTEARNRACLCRNCVMGFHDEGSRRREKADSQGESCGVVSREVLPPHVGGYAAVLPGDFSFDHNGLMVFTAAYHLRRGYCCGHECRHCPYEEGK